MWEVFGRDNTPVVPPIGIGTPGAIAGGKGADDVGGVLGGGVEAAEEEEDIDGGVEANVEIGLVASSLCWFCEAMNMLDWAGAAG